jgi:guanine deaminase
MSLVIRNGRVLGHPRAVAENADILVEHGTIRAIEKPGVISEEAYQNIDASDQLLVPGLVNGHSHSHGGLGKGAVGDRVSLEVFLAGSGAINGSRTREDKWLSAALTAVELVRKGCTAVYDLFVEYPVPSREGMDAVASAYAEIGMRAVVAPMMADRTLYQALPGLLESLPPHVREQVENLKTAPYEASIEAVRGILDGWTYDRERIKPGLGPTIPLHCSDDFLVSCSRLSKDYDVVLQTHLAESKAQAVLGLRKYGCSLTAHLDKLGLLNERFSAAHGVWIGEDDIRRLADRGAGVVHNPMSNLRLGSGIAPARSLLNAGVRLGIGTDATNTSDGQNMFEVLRLASYLSRVTTRDLDQWLSAEDVLTAASEGSASILGFDRIGKLERGFKADIVFLDLGHINYVPLRNTALQLAYAENGSAVKHVMIDGRFVLKDGHLLTVDEGKLRRRAEEAVARLDQANAAAKKAATEVSKLVGHFCIAHARSELQTAHNFATHLDS